MFNPLKSFGDLKAMREQAQQIQAQLANELIEVVEGRVKIVISGAQKVQSVEVDGVHNGDLTAAFNQAIKRSQEVAARKLMEISR